MLNTRLNDSCGSCPRCPGMLGAEWGRLPGEGCLNTICGARVRRGEPCDWEKWGEVGASLGQFRNLESPVYPHPNSPSSRKPGGMFSRLEFALHRLNRYILPFPQRRSLRPRGRSQGHQPAGSLTIPVVQLSLLSQIPFGGRNRLGVT